VEQKFRNSNEKRAKYHLNLSFSAAAMHMSLPGTDAASVPLTAALIDPTFSVAHKILCCIFLFQKIFS